jgi:hypothetical protein
MPPSEVDFIIRLSLWQPIAIIIEEKSNKNPASNFARNLRNLGKTSPQWKSQSTCKSRKVEEMKTRTVLQVVD